MRFLICAIAALGLVACTDRRDSPVGDETYVVERDGGGQIISAIADRRQLEAWGGRVEINGRCLSSCAIFTTLPNACLGPDAIIGFHGSNVPGFGLALAPYFRNGIREMFLSDWIFINGPTHKITAQEYVALDPETRLCE